MKKVFSKKFLVPVMAMLLCVAVAFGTGAIAAETGGNANIVINVNPDDTVKKYEGSKEEGTSLIPNQYAMGFIFIYPQLSSTAVPAAWKTSR